MSDTGETNSATNLSDQVVEQNREQAPPVAISEFTTGVAGNASVSIPDASWQVAVSNWWNEHVRNSPIAANTELLNHLGGILPHLKAFVEKELGISPSDFA